MENYQKIGLLYKQLSLIMPVYLLITHQS